MLWKLPQLFTPVTKRHVEQQVLHHTNLPKLFRIIQDVDQYSAFLPLCTYSKIIPNSQRILNNEDGRHYFEATLTVGVPPLLQETYDSAVYIDPQQYTIETHSIKSQKFDSLKSYWKLSSPLATTALDEVVATPSMAFGENAHPNLPNNIHPPLLHYPQTHEFPVPPSSSTAFSTDETTQVYFMVEMTVSDPLIVTTLDQLLVKVAKQQVAAFAQRCQSA